MKLKTHNPIYAVILVGGAGERLWPISRIKRPKYMMKIEGSESMVRQTVMRLEKIVPRKRMLFVVTEGQFNTLKDALKGFGGENFLVEPCARNTAVAIALAAFYIKHKEANAVMAVFPADHYIANDKGFKSAVKSAAEAAEKGYLVTLGIRPTAPLTEYGYIKIRNQKPLPGRKRGVIKSYYEVEEFIEKPSRKKAEKFIANGRFFWNAGIFAWRTDVILECLKKYMPRLYASFAGIEKYLGNREFGSRLSKAYKGLAKVSIDYGVMEKAKNRAMVVAKFDWTDLGSWLSLAAIHHKRDKDKNLYKGLSVLYDTKNCVVFGSRDHLIAAYGVKDLIVVNTEDATLIVDRQRAQDIKKIIEIIRRKNLKKYL